MTPRGRWWCFLSLAVATLVAGSLAVAVMATTHSRTTAVVLAATPPCPFITASSPQTLSTNPPPVPLNPCPGVVMGSYLGGKYWDWVHDVAVDPSGNVYVTGWTNSSDFPTTPGAYDADPNFEEGAEAGEAFVAKFDPSGALAYSTYIGGSSSDGGQSIALDPSGNVYVAGGTGSCDFPTTPGAYDTWPYNSDGGCAQGFITKFDPSGALVYSTLLAAGVMAISVDADGNAYVTGVTGEVRGSEFPTTPGAYVVKAPEGDPGVFVTKFDPTGTSLVYSAIVGREGEESVTDGAVDPSGAFIAVGGRPCTTCAGGLVFELNPAGTDLVYSMELPGSASGFAVDSNGVAHIVGTTWRPDFPVTPGAINTTTDGLGTFVLGLDGSGVLLYSALLGGISGTAISVDDLGQIYVTGWAESDSLLATPGAYDATSNGERDAFLVKLAPRGTALDYATYVGGGDEVLWTDIAPGYDKSWCMGLCGDVGFSVFFDRTGNATLVGITTSFDFPTTEGAHDTTYNGGPYDVFVIRLEPIPEPNRAPVAHFNVAFPPDNDARVDVDAKNSADAEDRNELLEVRWDWEDDKVWDTAWSTAKTASHEYAASGTYTIRLEVRDTSGLTSVTTRQVAREGLPHQTSEWSNLNPLTHPGARQEFGMAYDSESDRVILFGGWGKVYPNYWMLDDTWSYDFNTNTWTNLDPTIRPSARTGHAMAYDSESDRIILFGGRTIADPNIELSDTWSYDFNTNTWTNMNPTTAPSPRYRDAMAYDIESDRIIVFGGSADAHRSDETWAYDFNTNTWTNMNPSVRPPARFELGMAYDIESDRSIIFGGYVHDSGLWGSDTWAYDFNANSWVERNPPKTPDGRWGHAMSYDYLSDRVVLHGGSNWLGDTWLYDFDSDTWTGAAPSTSGIQNWFHAMAYDIESDGVILFGGDGSDETWAYFHEYTSSAPPTVAILFPQDGAILRSAIATVTGTASDDVALEKVEVSADGTTWILASGTASWSATITLTEGQSTIYARATDMWGNTATATISITVRTPAGPDYLTLGLAGAAVVGTTASGVFLFLRHRSPQDAPRRMRRGL